jgi:hypothetical protein
MLMRDKMTSANTEADFGLPGVVASSSRIRVVVIRHLDLTLIWRSGEQRERK